VTLAVDAVVIAGGLFLGRLVARVIRQRRQRQGRARVDSEAAPSDRAPSGGSGTSPSDRAEASLSDRADARRSGSRSMPSRPPRASGGADGQDRHENAVVLEGFACQLGDVIVRRLEGDEAWLAGALVLAEDRPVAALFIAPDAAGERAVLVPGPAQTTLTWLAPLAAGQVSLAREPPQAIEHAGTHFERTRRLPVRVQRLGTGAPQVGATAVMGEYAAAGLERLVVVVGPDAAFAWRGVSLSEAEYDVLPGGQATLET
jgi:hypothetical protein